MGYSGTYAIQVGFNEDTFRYDGRTLEEITLTLNSRLGGSKDFIRETLVRVFHPFSARIRMPERGEIYIYAQVQVPLKDFDTTAEKNSTDQIISPPRQRGRHHFIIRRGRHMQSSTVWF